MAVNNSESIVERLCKRTFLSLWSVANPQGKDPGKELCDLLVVCDPHVIVVSVKRVKATDHGRWHRKAIGDSAKQIAGACKHLERVTRVVLKDGSAGPPLPPFDRRVTHRIAVAFGSGGEVAYTSGDMEGAFVHVFTEASLAVIMSELDTILDFTSYLVAKERLLDRSRVVIIQGTELDLLGIYLLKNRSFPFDEGMLVVADDIWEGFQGRAEVARKREADRGSYAWDDLIERLAASVVAGEIDARGDRTGGERVLRQMALEPRFSRRVLSSALKDFVSGRLLHRARVVSGSESGVAYVLLNTSDEVDREATLLELSGRCFIVRGICPGVNTVVGIAFEWRSRDETVTMMLHHFEPDGFSHEDKLACQAKVRETGWFKYADWSRVHSDEYPR